MLWLARSVFLAAILDGVFLVYLILTGFPPEIAGHSLPLKNIRKPFMALIGLVLAGLLLPPDRKEKIKIWKEKGETFLSKPAAIWILVGVYGFLFLWQQIAEYLSIEINFIPFGFYDYMLYFLFQGKINFTNWLHGYYHLNNILILLAPLWYFSKSSLFLVVIYGFVASLAAFPLYGIAKKRFGEPVAPFFIALVYLNYRYLQNVLQMNFSVEIFYPLFIFAALFSAMTGRWLAYYGSVLLGLLVKEDSFIYFSALGLLVAFVAKPRRHGWITMGVALAYLLFLVKIFVPLTQSTILRGDLKNFRGYGSSPIEILSHLIRQPFLIVEILFGSEEKRNTWIHLLSRVGFLPLLSPAAVLIAAALFPLFLGGAENFIRLRFQYAAAVLPFVFIAFAFGFSNLSRRVPCRWQKSFAWAVSLVLLLINGGHYGTQKIGAEDFKSIAWAKSVPLRANLVTHGHLLPYIGYRKDNYYFAPPFENPKHPAHEQYANADYYLVDFNVPPFPWGSGEVEEKLAALRGNPRYKLVKEDGIRYLFQRKANRD